MFRSVVYKIEYKQRSQSGVNVNVPVVTDARDKKDRCVAQDAINFRCQQRVGQPHKDLSAANLKEPNRSKV